MSTDLKITQQELENRQLLITIEVPEERVEKAMRAAVKKFGKRLRVPGFRPGKAPYHIVVQRFGRQTILEDIADDLGQAVFAEAFEESEIQPFDTPVLEEITYDPLTYRIVVPLAPEVDPGAYRDLRVPLEVVTDEAVQELVEKEIERLREENKTWQPVDRPIEYGDLVTTSLKVTVDDEVVLDTDDWDFIPAENEYTMAPAFDAAFIGMQVGESKTFVTDIPENAESAWAGSTATFEIEIKGIKAQELPELNDDFAQEVSSEESYEAFVAKLAETAREILEAQEVQSHRQRVLKALREQAKINYPPALLEKRIDMLQKRQEDYYKAYGIESTEKLLKLLNKTEQEYREELNPEAKEEVETELVLDKIAELEQFEISDYERKQYLYDILKDDPDDFARLSALLESDQFYREYITSLVQRERIRDLLVAIAKGEKVPAPGEHPVVSEPAPDEEETDEAEAPTSEPGESADVSQADENTMPEAQSEASPQQDADSEDTLASSDSD